MKTAAGNAEQGAAEAEKDEFEPITLKECLDIFTADAMVELTCASCGSKDGFHKRSRFRTFPAVLAVNAQRFEVVNWVPTKQDVPVIVSDDVITLDDYLSKGPLPNEELLPDDVEPATETAPASGPSFVPNEVALSMLEAMGFPRVRCEKALHATGNSDTEAATQWLFSHMDDPDIDTPVDLGGAAGSGNDGSAVDPQKIEMLESMGFGLPQIKQALKATGGDVERAVEWLFSHPDAVGEFEEDSNVCNLTQLAHLYLFEKLLLTTTSPTLGICQPDTTGFETAARK
jgi:ubiquitin carboxyl-terminal hydrolase 5/13